MRGANGLLRWILLPVVLMAFLGMCYGAGAQPLKVMSYNIMHGTDASGSVTLVQQAAAIMTEAPDLVGLQEVDNGCRRSGGVDQMKVLAEKTGMHRAFAAHFDYQGGEYGNGLLSRFPLSDVRNDRISLIGKDGTTETRALLSAVAALPDGTTVTMASVHMGLNVESRVLQARELIRFLSERGGPVILTGDFNAEPEAEEVGILEGMFKNVGNPAEFTFAVGKPVKTIDYIMVSERDFGGAEGYRVLKDVPFSDHYPIVAVVKLRKDH